LPLAVAAACVAIGLSIAFYVNARGGSAYPRRVAAVAIPFGVALGVLPMALRFGLARLVRVLGGGSFRTLDLATVLASDGAVIVVYAFLAALGFGLFLATLAILALEHQQAYAVLSHPGFKHFVRLCVHPDGRVEGFTIGKDDPIAPGEPVLVDQWSFPQSKRPP
jgi:hypothetical protein